MKIKKKKRIERIKIEIKVKHPWLTKLLIPYLTIKLSRKFQVKLGDEVVMEMLCIPKLVISKRENEENTD